jgi:hypothetical protein
LRALARLYAEDVEQEVKEVDEYVWLLTLVASVGEI